jgi:hypothetical protein
MDHHQTELWFLQRVNEILNIFTKKNLKLNSCNFKVSNNLTHVIMTFADGNKMGLPLLPLNQVRAPPMMGPPPPPMNGTMSNQQQIPPQGGTQGQPPFTYINNGTHVMFKKQNGQIDYYKLNSAISRAVTETDINNFLNLLSSMGQLNQQLVNFISTSSLDDATKQQLLQLAQLFFKDPVNFWANNWSTVLSVVSKLPQSFLTQIQSLLFYSHLPAQK